MSNTPSNPRPLLRGAHLLERVLHGVWRPFTRMLGWRKPRQIEAYRSHGNREQVWVRGRVLGNRPHAGAQATDGTWQSLMHSRRRWVSFEVPDVEVGVRFAGQEQRVRADRDGYFEAVFERAQEAGVASCWLSAESWVPGTEVRGTHEVLVPGKNARVLLISDVDDTVIHTGATRLWTITRLTFFRGVHRRRALEGVPELYRKLVGEDGANPLFYVSSSAWNLYGMVAQIMELSGLPRGPLLLQRLGLANNRFVREPGHRHKLDKVETLLATYPELPAILIGDSGQHDARLYVDAAKRNPGRVQAICIRSVEPEQQSGHEGEIRAAMEEATELGVPMFRCASSAEMAEGLAPPPGHSNPRAPSR